MVAPRERAAFEETGDSVLVWSRLLTDRVLFRFRIKFWEVVVESELVATVGSFLWRLGRAWGDSCLLVSWLE